MTAIIVIFAFAGLIWGGIFLRKTGLLGGCFVVLLVGSCFGHPFFHANVGSLPLTADRVLLVGLFGACVLCRRLGLTNATAPLQEGADTRARCLWSRSESRSDGALAALVLILLVSTITHDWRHEGAQPLSALIVTFLIPAVLYWIARQIRLIERDIVLLFGGLIAFAVYLALTAIAEKQGWSGIIFPRYIASAEHTEFFGRARGPFLNPVSNGICLILGVCSLLLLGRRMSEGPHLHAFKSIVLASLFVLLCAGIYCTQTRSVWLGAGLSLSLVLLLTLPRRVSIPLLGLGAILGVLVLATQWERLNAFKRDKFVSVKQMSESAELRPILATIAWHMFQDRPILGCGYGQYGRVSVDYLSDRTSDLPLDRARDYDQHNVFFSLLTETGIVGTGFFTLLLIVWSLDAWGLWRTRSTPLILRQVGVLFLAIVGTYALNGLFHNVAVVPMANMYLFFLSGLINGLSHRAGVRTAALPTESFRGLETFPHPRSG